MAPFLSRSENTLNLIIEDSLCCVHCCLQEQVVKATVGFRHPSSAVWPKFATSAIGQLERWSGRARFPLQRKQLDSSQFYFLLNVPR